MAAKIGWPAAATAARSPTRSTRPRRRSAPAEPTAQVIYLEPDIYRGDYVPAERPEPPAPAAH